MLVKLRQLAKYDNPKRWRKMYKLGVSVFVICVLAIAPSISFAETLDVNYMEFNPDVVLSQDNGGSFEVGTLFSGQKTWIVTTPGDLLVYHKSSTYGQYSTLAVNKSTNKRYGQIMVTLGKDSAVWVRLALFDHTNPQFSSLEGSAGAAADVVWAAYSKDIKYFTGSSYVYSGYDHSDTEYHDVTINYDLQLDTYDIWYNDTKIADAVAFDEPIDSAESIGLAGAHYGPGISVLGYWHWYVSDAEPYTTAGEAMSGPTACQQLWDSGNGILSDLNQDCHVTMKDFVIFAGQWLSCNDPCDLDCE